MSARSKNREERLQRRWIVARASVLEDWIWYKIDEACKQLGISLRTFQRDRERARLVQTFEDWRVAKPGPKPGHRVPPDVYEIIEEETYSTAIQKRNYSKLSRDVDHKLVLRGKPAVERPSPSVVKRIAKEIEARNPAHFKNASEGREGQRDLNVIRGHASADRPLQIVQIDHTRLDDITLIGPGGKYTFRPWITVATDLYSGVDLAAFLMPWAPSSVSVAMCMAMIVSDKTGILRGFDVPGPWDQFGIPEVIHVDNAKEFHADAINFGAQKHGITIKHEWPGYPDRKAEIERHWGTLNKEIHTWAGTTLSNPKEREKYKGLRLPNMHFAEAQRRLLLAVQEYNHETYGGTELPPVEVWRRHENSASFIRSKPQDPRRCFIDFLPYKEADLGFEGIKFARCLYASSDLAKMRHEKFRKVIFHYDTRDISNIFVRYLDQIVPVPRVYPTAAPKDRWELKRWFQERTEDARKSRNADLLAQIHAAKHRSYLNFFSLMEEGNDPAIEPASQAVTPPILQPKDALPLLGLPAPLGEKYEDGGAIVEGEAKEFSPTPLKPRLL
jgi:putative transposase